MDPFGDDNENDDGFGGFTEETQGNEGEEEEEEEEEQEQEQEEEEEEEEDVWGAAAAAPQQTSQSNFGQKEEDEYAIMREWTKKWREKNEEKDREANEKRKEIQEQARQDLANFFDQRQKTKEVKMETNRTEEQQLIAQMEADKSLDNPWERVCKMCDTASADVDKTHKDISRLRAVLIRLKAAPLHTTRQENVLA